MTQAYNLSQLANNLDSSGRLDATDGLVNSVPVANGGTGASSVAAAVSNLSASIYPVGSIYINAAVATNPGTLLGFGTWVAFASGRVLVGVDTSDSAFDTPMETGGSKDAILPSHDHFFSGTTSTAGAHQHAVDYPLDCTSYRSQFGSTTTSGVSYTDTFCDSNGGNENIPLTQSAGDHSHTFSGSTGPRGQSATNGNLQPYITVYMWRRTA